MVETAKRITNSFPFQILIIALIILAGALSGVESYLGDGGHPGLGRFIDVAQQAILWAFVVEIALKIVACGAQPWRYFASGWNVFDFAIVAVCFLPIDAEFSAVLRMARLVRTLRLVAILPRLQLLVGAMLKSIPSLAYIGLLLGLHFYIYAVLGTSLFGENDPLRFGSLHESFLTLFQVLTLEGWNDILATQYLGSDMVYDDTIKALYGARVSEAQPLLAAAYFVSFIMLGTMIMLNLFTGVIITSMEEATNEAAEEKRKRHQQRGFTTLRDELSLVSRRLKEISAQLEAMETPPEPAPVLVAQEKTPSLT